MDIFKAFGHRATVLAPVTVVDDDCDELLELMQTWDLTYAQGVAVLRANDSWELNAAAHTASAGWRARVASDAGATTGDVLAVGIAFAMAWLGQYLAGTVT